MRNRVLIPSLLRDVNIQQALQISLRVSHWVTGDNQWCIDLAAYQEAEIARRAKKVQAFSGRGREIFPEARTPQSL